MTALLVDNLATLAEAPGGSEKLRRLILDLALRGALAPQDSTEEPASTLLLRIASLKASTPSRSKASSHIAAGEAPFRLPKGWVWTTLSEAALINPRNQADDQVEVSFVPMAAIGVGFNEGHKQELRRWADVKTGFTHFAEGDVGVAKITPCFENSKACVFSGLANGLGAGTTELHIVRPLPGTLVPHYVLAYLKSTWFLKTGESKMTGTAGQKRLPRDFVERHPFPLPPVAEQQRIVAKVSELISLCDRLETRIADARNKQMQLAEALVTQALVASV